MLTTTVRLAFTKSLASLVTLGAMLFSLALPAEAGEANLAWDASTSAGVAGYQLYYGQASGNYTGQVDVGNQVAYTLPGLQDGTTYYFAAKAYSSGKTIWSGFSNEVSATIAPPTAAPTASFTASPTSGTAPLAVTFIDASTGNITSRSWNFGDGTTSIATNAAKTYTNPGNYTVILTATGPGGSNTATKTISATPAAPVANFTATPTSGIAPLAVSFTNTSTGNATAWSWSFGDSGTSTAQHPSHSYATAGTYAVSLTATGPGGSNTKTTLSGYITVTSNGGGGSSTAGLVGAYNFEEANGTTVVDASGQSNKGTISGATRVTTGRFGKALSFDGVNDLVTVNDAASLDLTTGMTLEAWVYPTVNMSGWQSALIKENPAHGLAYELYANTDTSQPAGYVYVGGYRWLHGGPWLLANTWAHLASTYDGTTQRLYVNGTEVAAHLQSGPIEVSSGALRIGGNSVWGEFFQGRIDEIRIYNRALNAAEIQTDTNQSVTSSSPPITLIGTKTIGSSADSNPQGRAEAFQTTATTTGLVTGLSVYVGSGSTATSLVAGLYANNNGHPGARLARGTLTSPTAGSWNTVSLPATSVTAGSTYWIAVLGPSGVLQFRQVVGGGGSVPSETSAKSTLTTLPSSWTTGTVNTSGPLSAYGAGYK